MRIGDWGTGKDVNEEQAAEKFIYSKLSGSAALVALVSDRMYPSLAPEGTVRPFVTWNIQFAHSVHSAGSDVRILTLPLIMVQGVADGTSYAPVDAIVSAIDAALTDADLDVTFGGVTYHIQGCRREEPVRYLEVVEGRRVWHAGGVYRLFISHS